LLKKNALWFWVLEEGKDENKDDEKIKEEEEQIENIITRKVEAKASVTIYKYWRTCN
jgi:hypothetical protein